jgi:hypothetical protein
MLAISFHLFCHISASYLGWLDLAFGVFSLNSNPMMCLFFQKCPDGWCPQPVEEFKKVAGKDVTNSCRETVKYKARWDRFVMICGASIGAEPIRKILGSWANLCERRLQMSGMLNCDALKFARVIGPNHVHFLSEHWHMYCTKTEGSSW